MRSWCLSGVVMMVAMVVRTEARAAGPAADYAIRPAPFTAVRLVGGFWGARAETNRAVTVPYCFRKCEETGRIRNFAVAGGLEKGGFEGIFFNDSDVYKVIEGACYSLMVHPDPELERYLDGLIAKIAAAQEPDGYLYTARTINDPKYNYPGKGARWSHTAHGHELYNVGHMYEAAVAHYQATGKRSLLDVAIKNADLVCATFGPDALTYPPGHEEIEIGLVKLYRATGQKKYLDEARFFVDTRGHANRRKLYGAYNQDHEPVIEQTEAVGHAVRAGYLYAGVADIAALTGEASYAQALDRLWDDVVGRKLYLTGGIGASRHGEAFGEAYTLPNDVAYAETCAAIANMLWNHRMFLLHGDARYLDVFERTLYNGFLSGVSLGGDRFFYPNPLEADGKRPFNHGSAERAPWFGCSCCPVNIVRIIPQVSGYVYAARDDRLYVCQYGRCEGKVQLGAGDVALSQETDYPWGGDIALKLTALPAGAGAFDVALRIPEWAEGRPLPSELYRYLDATAQPFEVRVNGAPVSSTRDKGFCVVNREWQVGDTVTLRLPMPVRRAVADDRVEADRGLVALERGPLVYCVEACDVGGTAPQSLVLADDATPEVRREPGLLGGVTTITAPARAVELDASGTPATRTVELKAIPYYAWNHRGVGAMSVWLARGVEAAASRAAGDVVRTKLGTLRASYRNPPESLEALSDGKEPKNSIDHDIPRCTFWPHLGTKEWIEVVFPKPRGLTAVSVYWFDDTGRGKCRVPESWTLDYRVGKGEWRPFPKYITDDYGVLKDQYNVVHPQDALTVDALRINVQLQKGVSGGILEVKVD